MGVKKLRVLHNFFFQTIQAKLNTIGKWKLKRARNSGRDARIKI